MAYGNSLQQRTTPVVLNLIIINALAYFAQVVFGSSDNQTSVIHTFALHHYGSQFFEPYQIVTHMFMHGSFFHLLFNMLGLWMFGTTLERLWGPQRFLIFYLICGLIAALTQMGFLAIQFADADPVTNTNLYITSQISATLGASGAVMGILAAYGYLFPNTMLFIMPIPFPIKTKWAVIGIILIDVFSGIFRSASGIAHFAHVGGAIAGFLIVFYWNKTKKTFY